MKKCLVQLAYKKHIFQLISDTRSAVTKKMAKKIITLLNIQGIV